MTAATLLDQHGRALPPAPRATGPAPPRQPRLRAEVFGGAWRTPRDAASYDSAELAGWEPRLESPDREANPWRERITARIRDIVRNDGWASGGVSRLCDAVVGGDLRPILKPDYRSLARWSPAFDAAWAQDYQRAAEAVWRDWANDSTGRWCDLARQHTFARMAALAFRAYLVDGDACAYLPWRPNRVGPGRATYATCVQLLDSDRLSNPNEAPDSEAIRAGVELDADGAAQAYHFRRAYRGDAWSLADQMTWDRLPRETEFGRPILVHHFDAERPGQVRGAGGLLAPVLARMKMLAQYDRQELQASLVNATLAAFIESPNDPDSMQDALEADGTGSNPLASSLAMRAEFHQEARLSLHDTRIPVLFPGEKINTVQASRPSAQYDAFAGAVLRNIASAIGMSRAQLSLDFSDMNYSSARAALVETRRTLRRRRLDFASGFCAPILAAVLEEAHDRGELPLPAQAPAFEDARAAYTAAMWIGPAQGWIDPVKEPMGAQLAMEIGTTTLETVCAEQGLDYEEVLDQRALEIQAFRARGIPLPEWAGDAARLAATDRERAE